MKTLLKISCLLLMVLLLCITGALAEGFSVPQNTVLVKNANNSFLSSLNQPIEVDGIGSITVLRCDRLSKGEETTPIRLSFLVFNTTTSAMNYRENNISSANLYYNQTNAFDGKVYQCSNREKLDVYDKMTDWNNRPAYEDVPVLLFGYYYIEYNVPNAVLEMPGSIIPGFTIGDTELLYCYRDGNSEMAPAVMREGELVISNPTYSFAPSTLNQVIDIPRVGMLTVLRCDVGDKGSQTTPIVLSFIISNTTDGEKNYRDNVIRRRKAVFANKYEFSGSIYQCFDREKLDTYSFMKDWNKNAVSEGVPTLQNGYFFISYDVANSVFEMPGSIILTFYLSDTEIKYCYRGQ